MRHSALAVSEASGLSMTMPVVDIRTVPMCMEYFYVFMLMCVLVTRINTLIMTMLMMCVVDVTVIMRDLLMLVFVLVPLCDVQPETRTHEYPGKHETRRHFLSQKEDRENCTPEGGQGKIRSRPGCTNVAQRHDKEGQTQPVAQKPEEQAHHGFRGRAFEYAEEY